MLYKKLLPIVFFCCYSYCLLADGIAVDTAIYSQTFCSNQLVIINDHVYSPFNPEGLEVIPGGGFNGADSIFLVKLAFKAPAERNFNTTICEGDTIFVNNRAYHLGHYKDTEIFENGAVNGCDSIVYVTVEFDSQPFSYLFDTLCEYETLEVNGTVYDKDNNTGLEILKNGAASGCDSLVYVSLHFRQSWVYLGEDRSLVEGDSVCLQLTSRYDAQDIAWTPPPPCGDPSCASFCIEQIAGGLTYTVIFTDIYGCTSTDDVRINVSSNHLVYGPNIFTPGAAAPNDRFFLRADPGVTKVNRLVIFDRWGEPVFEQHDIPNDDSAYDSGWDGTWKNRALENGVYGWWAELESFQGRRFIKTGDVAILKP